MRSTTGLALMCALLVGACGDDLTVQNVSPHGTVGGLVVDAATGMPLLGVNVRMFAGGTLFDPVTTDELGYFSFDSVPAGNLVVTIDPPAGYWGATVHGAIIGAAGQFSVDNEALSLGPIGLLPANTHLNLRVVDERGRPVTGSYQLAISTLVEWVDFASGDPEDVGRRGFAVTTDANGIAVLPALPDFWRLGVAVTDTLVISLPPFDADGDGAFEFAGGVQTLALRTLADPMPDIVLDPGFSTSLTVVASTLGSLESGFPGTPLPAVLSGGEPIFIKFNLPIDPLSMKLALVNEDGVPVTPAPALEVDDELVKITFNPSLPVGGEFNLSLHVVAAVGDRQIEADVAAPFFTRSGLPNVTAIATLDGATGLMRITFSEPVGTGSSGANDLSGSNCVLFFNADLNGSGGLPGDIPGELGNPDCDGGIFLRAFEPDPIGPVGLSGFTRYWEFPRPAAAGAGTQLHMIFSRVPNQGLRLERPDGRVLEDFVGATVIVLP